MSDLTTHLLTDVEVDQVLPPPHSLVLLLVCQQETQSSLSLSLSARSELFKQEVVDRKSGLHSFVNKTGRADMITAIKAVTICEIAQLKKTLLLLLLFN